jgi:hypothetical protein
VFEKLNTGGVTLTVFGLVTAIFASENFNLREDWRQRKNCTNTPFSMMWITMYLQSVTLLASNRAESGEQGISCFLQTEGHFETDTG